MTTPYPTDFANALGIRYEAPHGHRVVTLTEGGHTQVEVGKCIHIGGIMHVIPKHHITATETRVLNRHAEGAYFDTPEEDAHWKRSVVQGVTRWTTYVTAVYPSGAIATNTAELTESTVA